MDKSGLELYKRVGLARLRVGISPQAGGVKENVATTHYEPCGCLFCGDSKASVCKFFTREFGPLTYGLRLESADPLSACVVR